VYLRFDGQPVNTAAGHIRAQAADCRSLAAQLRAIGQVVDVDLRRGLSDLVEVCADAFELVGLDLDLLAARMRAGALLYDAVESGIANGNRR
jgi:hypothetical protein